MRPSRDPASQLVSIVVAGAGDPDRGLLSQAADRRNWDIQFTSCCEEAWTVANQLLAPIILWDRDLPETEWREAVRTLASLPNRPIVIILSKAADENLYGEVFRAGGFDILVKPLRTESLLRTVKLALSYWRSEAATAAKHSE
jgi:DNA-binding response OmpR family regulator